MYKNPMERIKTVMDFVREFNTDEKCIKYLNHLKYGESGWQCYKCHYKEYNYIQSRQEIRCKRCGYEESITANSIMRGTRKPLTEWFWTIYTIATQKTGISAMELYRQMDFGSYETAWTWLQKIRLGMVSENRDKLKGTVEVDETYIFTGDERGRSLKGNKALIVCAVEVYKDYASGDMFLRHIDSASAANLESFVKDHVEKGSKVITDGWRCYAGLKALGYDHQPITIDKPEDASKELPRVHRVFANLQAWIIGTHRFVSKKHLQNYLNEYSTRFDARYNPIEIFNDILKLTMNVKPRIGKDFMDIEKPYYPNPVKKKIKHRKSSGLFKWALFIGGAVLTVWAIGRINKNSQNNGAIK